MRDLLLSACQLREAENLSYQAVIDRLGLGMSIYGLRRRVRRQYPNFDWKNARWRSTTRVFHSPPGIHRTVVISDLHWELRHRGAVTGVSQFVEDLQPNLVVLAGDIFDNDLMSTHLKTKKARLIDLGDEIRDAAPWINHLAEVSERAVFLVGNHEDRAQRLVQREQGIPTDLLDWNNLFETFGILDDVEVFEQRTRRELFTIGQVSIIHGDRCARHQAWNNLSVEYPEAKCIIQGHTHRPQLYYWKGRVGVVNGHLADLNQQSYMKNPKWTMGITLIVHFDNMQRFNVYFVSIDEEGKFEFAGMLYPR